MHLPIDFEGRFFVRFSPDQPFPAADVHGAQTSGALSFSDAQTFYLEGQAGGLMDPPTEALLSPAAIQLSQDQAALRHIWAAMDKTRQKPYRFNRKEDFGALYLAFDRDTATAEASHHFCTFREENPLTAKDALDYVCVEVNIDPNGRYWDLRDGVPAEYPDCLSPCWKTGYEQGQAFAAEKRADGYQGIIYPSVRYETGVCLALFALQKITLFRQGKGLTLRWDSSKKQVVVDSDELSDA